MTFAAYAEDRAEARAAARQNRVLTLEHQVGTLRDAMRAFLVSRDDREPDNAVAEAMLIAALKAWWDSGARDCCPQEAREADRVMDAVMGDVG